MASNSNNNTTATTGTLPITSPLLFTPPPSSIEIQSLSDTSSLSTVMMGHKTSSAAVAATTILNPTITRKKIRSNHIRILVLGPPTDIPNDFNLYLHHNIEVMISSAKMARALMEWVADCDGRKIAEVDQVANERKQELLETSNLVNLGLAQKKEYMKQDGNQVGLGGGSAATLTSLQGNALGKEFLEIMANKAKDVNQQAENAIINKQNKINGDDTGNNSNNGNGNEMKNEKSNNNMYHQPSTISILTQKNPRLSPIPPPTNNNSNGSSTNNEPFPFNGIENVAKESRTRELAAAKIMAHFTGEEDFDDDDGCDDTITENLEINIHTNNPDSIKGFNDNESHSGSKTSTLSPSTLMLNEDKRDDTAVVSTVSSAVANAAIAAAQINALPIKVRKKIRWHALIDSGMGRLGFKSVEDDDDDSKEGKEDLDSGAMFTTAGQKKIEKWKAGPHKDTVSIIKAMCHAEIDGAPIEFHGMCTHMAEASSNSSYTNEQMVRFKSLLKRVRQANISVPTISTDNSAALLTPTLTHFDPVELLSQPNADTRGYVRTGGAVYGQRPVFTQLRPVSTLTALVRHVATLMKGETVGYDRAYKAEKNVRIATLSIGFADGYPRELGNGKGQVCIRGETFPIAGNVCMDMLMVDLGCADDICGVGSQVSIGDTAYLWGDDIDNDGEGKVRLQDIAGVLKTTQSALTCGLDKTRVQRQYVD